VRIYDYDYDYENDNGFWVEQASMPNIPNSIVADICIQQPGWIERLLDDRPALYTSDDARMTLVLALARANIAQGTGGPFGAAVFEAASGGLLSVGVNLVTSAHCSIAHAEMVALAAAQQSLGHHDLGFAVPGGCILVSSAEPCAMCMGALPWAGIGRLVCAARDEDVRAIGFDEGDKPPAWPALLQARGIGVTRDLMRAEAIDVLQLYEASGGEIYGPTES
jgi:tRNA(Arg) A34 adenosine deaminase TadA